MESAFEGMEPHVQRPVRLRRFACAASLLRLSRSMEPQIRVPAPGWCGRGPPGCAAGGEHFPQPSWCLT